MARKKRIGELLIEQNAITHEQLQEALEAQKERGGRLIQVLIGLGHLTEEGLLACLGNQSGVVSVNVRQYSIDPALRQYVPQEFAVEYELMPLDKLGNNLTVAMAMPLDEATRQRLEEQTGLRVRAVLCSRGDVRATIEQYYGLLPADAEDAAAEEVETPPAPAPDEAAVAPGPEAVRLSGVTDLLDSVDQFPLLPEIHARILEQIEAPECSVAAITDLIIQDPTLATNILKLANSAAYAARSTFTSVQRAVAYIGLRELHGIVIGAAILEAMSARTSFDLNRLFLRAFHCGLLTKIIGDVAKLDDRDMAFTAGLLHDIGTIVIRVFTPERLENIDQLVADTGRPRVEIEAEVLGLTASEIGYQLTQHWNIPEPLGLAIRFYDRLDSVEEGPPVACAIALALRCIAQDDAEDRFADPAEDETLADLLHCLGLTGGDLHRIEERYRDGMADLTRLDRSIT